MATNITAEWTEVNPGTGAGTTVQKAAISLNDVVVNTTPNTTGGWNTATVTADVVRRHSLGATNGVPSGIYEKVGDSTFRRQ
jgi:hypothetical protein